MYEKNILKNIFNSLSSKDQKLFLSVVNYFVSEQNVQKLNQYEKKLEHIINKIDTINAQREELSKEHKRLVRIKNKFKDIEKENIYISILLYIITHRIIEIKTKIAESRPDKYLKTKFDLRNSIELMKQSQYWGEKILKILDN